MANPLRFHPQVVLDVREATLWYDEISTDLGNRFRSAIDGKLDSIEQFPESFGLADEPLRAAIVDGFPFLVIYEFRSEATGIFGVFHSAADPKKWRGRMS